MEWLDIIHGPNLTDLDPGSKSLEVKRSESFFLQMTVENCCRESRQKLKCNLSSSLNILLYDYGRTFLEIGVSRRSKMSDRNEVDYK